MGGGKSLRLAIVVPCYREQEVLPATNSRLAGVLDGMVQRGLVAAGSFVAYVNDGSGDGTWPLIKQYHEQSPGRVMGVNLAHNAGHQCALMAGMEAVVERCDAVVTIDADLQDDPDVIPRMVEQHLAGHDVVYGVRASRATDTWFKRATALGFYRMMGALGCGTVYNHADYRLMSSRAVRWLLQYGERNLFLRGIVPLIGQSPAVVTYDRAARQAGESKYPLRKMLAFALDGITSFSVKPIRLVMAVGGVFLLVALCVAGWVLWQWTRGVTLPGWASLMVSVWFCSGCVLLGLGVVGEYIGKIYVEVKRRPRHHVAEVLPC